MAAVRVECIALTFVNAYLLRGEGCVLVDAGFARNPARLRRALQRLGVQPSELRLILLSHGHTDHYGSASALQTLEGTPIAMHPLDAQLVRTGRNSPLQPTCALGHVLSAVTRLADHMPAQALAVNVWVEEGFDLSPYGVEAQVLHTPGHTPGSISVLAGEIAVVGDLLMSISPQPHRPGLPLVAEDVEQLLGSVRHLVQFHPQTLYAGHGGPFSGQDVAAWLARQDAAVRQKEQ